MTDGRITRVSLEVIGDGDPDVRITRAALEVAGDGDPDVRITRAALEVIATLDEYVEPPKDIGFFLHLLPRAHAWTLTKVSKRLHKFWEALTCAKDDFVAHVDQIWLDMFPAYTRELSAWEAVFGLYRLDLTEAERRQRLSGLWAATGGQSPRYIQDTLQAAGFDVYVHEWWDLPLTDPPVVRNPFLSLGGVQPGCSDPFAECGEPIMECGNFTGAGSGYMLVNKLYTARTFYTCLCGEASMECGEPDAQCGENSGVIYERVNYPIPSDPDQWPYIIYIGGETFGDFATVSASRFDELEDLILKIVPAHLWVGMLVDFINYLVEDFTLNNVIDDFTSDDLIEVI